MGRGRSGERGGLAWAGEGALACEIGTLGEGVGEISLSGSRRAFERVVVWRDLAGVRERDASSKAKSERELGREEESE